MTTKQMTQALVLAAVLAAGPVTGAAAQTLWTVTSNADSGPGSLRDTVAGATPGDTIRFDMARVISPIALSSGQIVLDKDVTIEGPGANLLAIRNTAPLGTTSRVLLVQSGVTVTISGLTVTGGNVLSPENGGGILSTGVLTVSYSTVSGNAATGGFGGGIAAMDGSLTVAHSTISDNFAEHFGGGVLAYAPTVVTHSTISGNRAAHDGGALLSSLRPLTVANSTISGNSATSAGIYVQGGPATFLNSTVSGNSALFFGGLFAQMATVTLRNTILAGNQGTGGDCLSASSQVTAEFSLIASGLNCLYGSKISNLTGDPLLGPLEDNGGPTLTHALQQGSPAIDAGSDAAAMTAGLTTDQRGAGASRFVGGSVDIGAFEYDLQPKFLPAAPLTLERGSVGGASAFVGTAVVGGSQTPVLNVGQVAGGTATGLSFVNPTVVSSGAVFAVTPPVSCTQTGGTIRFRVTDLDGLSGEGDLQVNVVPSTVGGCTCPVGSAGDGTTCTCLPGFYKPAGASSCQPASPGFFVSDAGQIAQTACAVGTYQPNSGAVSCLVADPGHYVAAVASEVQTACDLGKYQPDAGQTGCLLADPGFYVPTIAAVAQLACPVGTTSAAGASACTPIAPVFPTSAVLDTFNRPNGAAGTSWAIGATTLTYRIAGNRLDAQLGGPLVWAPASFGASQEAFVTFAAVDTRSPSQGVLLKVQTGSVPNAGAISVVYDALAQRVRVSTLRTSVPVWQPYAGIAATFVNGDQLGARALANGTVEVYKNGTRVGTVTLSSSDQAFFNAKGGRIGLWTLAASAAFFDDFGGGTSVP